MLRPIALTALATTAVFAAGCSPVQRIDASTAEAFAASLQRYATASGLSVKDQRAEAAAALKALYLSEDSFREELPEGVPPVITFHRLRFDDVQTYADRVVRWSQEGRQSVVRDLPEETVTERRWRNQFLIDQLTAQEQILTAAQSRARYTDLFTVDQFKFGDSSFIPPQEGVPLGEDKALFTTSFHNSAIFNLYKVGFHVTVTDPKLKAPLVDEVLVYDAGKEPIQVGETRQINVSCCDSFSNPTINLALRSLAPDAEISMELVSVFDYSKSDRLKSASFSFDQSQQLAATKACLKDISDRIQDWTPETASPACSAY